MCVVSMWVCLPGCLCVCLCECLCASVYLYCLRYVQFMLSVRVRAIVFACACMCLFVRLSVSLSSSLTVGVFRFCAGDDALSSPPQPCCSKQKAPRCETILSVNTLHFFGLFCSWILLNICLISTTIFHIIFLK